MFSINQISEVEQVQIDARNMDFNDVSLQESTTINKQSPTNQQQSNTNANPLFNNPNRAPKNGGGKTRIRV